MREEAHFSWDEVEVGADDRSLVLKAIHSPDVWSDDDAWFNGGRADLWYGDEAIGVLLWLAECSSGDPGAAPADDPTRQVRTTLDQALAGRVVYDAVYGLREAEGGGRGRPTRWEKVQVAGASTLVVYWHGGIGPLDRVDVRHTQDAVEVTVLEEPARKMAGRSSAAIVRLDEPLAGRRIRRGQAR